MAHDNICFIGGGNMAGSLIGGLIAGGCKPDTLWVADPSDEQRETLVERFGIQVSADNAEAAADAEIIVLAVKPQMLQKAVAPLSKVIERNHPLIISIAAGIAEPDIRRWLGGSPAIVRAMPNTPALVRSGATALYGNEFVTDAQRDKAESILRAVGIVQWVEDETLMDAVTALSGSGPAYFFLLMEVLEAAGKSLGLPAEAAHLLTLQTAYGAAKMALESADSPETLRKRVTSPGGTTEAALEVLQDADIHALFRHAVHAARDRGRALSKEFGEE